MKDVRIETPGIALRGFFQHFQERVAVRAALHAREDIAAGVLQRDIQIFCQARMGGNGVEQARRDAIRIAIEEAHPVQVFHLRETFEEQREAVAQAQVFAVESGVLADKRNFAHTCGGEIFRFAHDRFKTAAAEFSAKLRDHAESAGMIAAFVNLDVSGVARRGENARRQVVVEISGQLRRAASFERKSPSHASRIFSISPVPMTASTSGICSRISLR